MKNPIYFIIKKNQSQNTIAHLVSAEKTRTTLVTYPTSHQKPLTRSDRTLGERTKI